MAKLPWSLSELIAPLSVAEFREAYWGRRAFATRIPAGALAWLRSELEDFDVTRLVRRYRGQIAIWFHTLDEQLRVVAAASGDDALALYNAGKTIFLHNGGATPSVIKWERQLAEDAGHPAVPLTASLFLSRTSAATGPHFDMLENITIQLSGHKRWKVAPNPHVRQPLENWALGQTASPALEQMLDQPLPAQMPAGAESFDLTEGTLLYIPRGHFHQTDAAQDSVSLFLGMPVASWADLLLDALRGRLEQLPHWRENVPATDTPDRLQHARARLDRLRAGLGADLAGVDAAAMLPDAGVLPLTDERRLRRNPLAIVQLGRRAPRVTVTLQLGKFGRSQEYTVPEDLRPVLAWIAARASFEVREAIAAHPATPRNDVLELLGVLQTAGALI